MNSKKQKLEMFFNSMWLDYLALNPDADKIYQLFSQNNQVKMTILLYVLLVSQG